MRSLVLGYIQSLFIIAGHIDVSSSDMFLQSTGNQLWLLCHATGALLHLPEQIFQRKKNYHWETQIDTQENLGFC